MNLLRTLFNTLLILGLDNLHPTNDTSNLNVRSMNTVKRFQDLDVKQNIATHGTT